MYQRFRRKLVVALGLFALTTTVTARADEPSPTKFLQGHIFDHRAKLPALGAEITRADSLPGYLAKLPVQDEWYPIPDWLAGQWQQEQITTVADYDFATDSFNAQASSAVARARDLEGWQQDSRGGRWNYIHTPFTSTCEGESLTQLYLVRTLKPLEVSENRVMKLFEGTSLMVDNASGLIKNVAQTECIESYEPIDRSHILCRSSVKEFSADGVPVRLSLTYSLYRRAAEFAAVSFHQGRDVRESFCRYLKSHGLGDLEPGRFLTTCDSH